MEQNPTLEPAGGLTPPLTPSPGLTPGLKPSDPETAWCPASVSHDRAQDPGGTLGYAEVIAVQTGFIAEATNIDNLMSPVTVAASSRIKITASVPVRQLATDGVIALEIFEGGTKLGRAVRTIAAGDFTNLAPSLVLTPTAGSHTYNLKMATTAGTANVEAATDSPAYILVEDI